MIKRKKKKRPFESHPWSLGKMPTADEVRNAWNNRKRSLKDFIWLLSVLGELTCFTDYHLKCKGGFGNIEGRKGGLKEYLSKELPDLACKYKSISRYARLAYRIKRAFDYYPPGQLSLMHPDLPLPKINFDFITNYARQIYRENFKDLPPEYNEFLRVVIEREEKSKPRHKWGAPLPQEEWGKAEYNWRRYVVLKKLRQALGDRDSSGDDLYGQSTYEYLIDGDW